MARPPLIFDRALLQSRRLRAWQQHGKDADFLLSHVCQDMAERLSIVLREFPMVLELGGHTGQLAEMILGRKGTNQIFRQEHNCAFLHGAGQTNSAPILPLVADEEALPIAPQSMDLILSPLNLQWVNDLPGSLFQIRNSLKPDGLFLATLLGNESLKELRTSFLQAEAELTDGVSPRIAPFPELKDMGSLLQRAGFSLPVADQDIVTVRYGSMFSLMADLRKMGATNCLADRSRAPLRRDVLMRTAEIYQSDFADSDGKIRASFQIVSISGWAPHESQQKPLKPGSAQTHFSKILKDKSS
ncbi:methyltransferase domain-containing protein [Cohaesibacter gelatinilyticus]|uniref:Methyltransferase domain-containing protein n=1 Tax=Cohaesibacter gelatinilyticus TaxID=372072 RepID=A0A285PHB1_9HYPH|nr:methyltransferase domain-containing protein [Cohaesibacter gelatinilyticus]SNZ20798.1 Methyltransferase domain-containing protein [Cohaesibacter gelatinilyticus]